MFAPPFLHCLDFSANAWENAAVGGYQSGAVLVEQKEEYFLLYYGKWKWEEKLAEAFPQLTYCVRIGALSNADAVNLAMKYRVNYLGTAGRMYKFHGFSLAECCEQGIEAEADMPFYEMRTRQSMPSRLWVDCGEAMVRLNKKRKNGESDETIDFMRKIILTTRRIKTLPSLSARYFDDEPIPKTAGEKKTEGIASTKSATASVTTQALKKGNPRRNQVERAKAIDSCILDYWFHVLIGEPQSQQDIARKHGVGDAALSQRDARELMVEMSNCKHGAPVVDIHGDSGKKALYDYLKKNLAAVRKEVAAKKKQNRTQRRKRSPVP